MSSKNVEKFATLFEQIIKIEGLEECANFFDDLCTVKELEAMTQRIEAAKMLLDGKTYSEVMEKTEISSATLSRVSRCVHYGDGGYKSVIEK